MSKYKEENGTTRVGDLLRGLGDIGKPILDAAGSLTGQPWLNAIASQITTSKELNEQQKQAALNVHVEDLRDAQNARDNETARDTSENSSWLTKNIHEIIALAVFGAWISSLFFKTIIPSSDIISVVLMVGGYLFGRSKPQQ